VLADADRDRRQLEDLVAVRLAGALALTWLEAPPAARAALGPVLDDLVELRDGHELASRTLVAGLTARLAGARSLGLWNAARRLARRRQRGVARVLAQLLLEALDPRLQASDLALMARRQLDQELDASLATGVIDRFRLGALHAPRFDAAPTSPVMSTAARSPAP